MNKKNINHRGIFPKIIPELTEEQKNIKYDFMKHWLMILRKNYGIVDKFNHNVVFKNRPQNFLKTLEIGAGIGEHLNYEILSDEQKKNYYALDVRKNVLDILSKEHSSVNAVLGDCEKKLKFEDKFFDRVIAIHILEHLPNLPSAINEIHRVLKNNGCFQVVIPCEGSLAYTVARKISAERIFKKKYNTSYDWYIKSEHINLPFEIFDELKKKFNIVNKKYFPLPVPVEFCNLCIGLNLSPKIKT